MKLLVGLDWIGLSMV